MRQAYFCLEAKKSTVLRRADLSPEVGTVPGVGPRDTIISTNTAAMYTPPQQCSPRSLSVGVRESEAPQCLSETQPLSETPSERDTPKTERDIAWARMRSLQPRPSQKGKP